MAGIVNVKNTGGGYTGYAPGYEPGGVNNPTPTTDPTPAKVPRYPTPDSTTGKSPTNSVDTAESAYEAAAAPESAAQVSARISALYANELAAVKAKYADLSKTQTVTNENNMGRTRATAAASGVLGSDFGNAQLDTTSASGERALGEIANEEQSAEAAIYTSQNKDIESEMATERTTGQNALKDRISYLKDVAAQAQTKVQTLASTTPLSDLPQETYDALYQRAGFDTPEEFNAYYEAAHAAAVKANTKLVGDSTTGFYEQTYDATGNPTYKNVIAGKPIDISGSQYGNYLYDPGSGEVKTISPGQQYQIKSAGGQLWRVENSTGKATPLTPRRAGVDKVGWAHASIDQQLAVQRWVEDEAKNENVDPAPLLQQVQGDQTKFLSALNASLTAGYYTPVTVQGTGTDTSAADAAAASAQDAADAAANGQ